LPSTKLHAGHRNHPHRSTPPAAVAEQRPQRAARVHHADRPKPPPPVPETAVPRRTPTPKALGKVDPAVRHAEPARPWEGPAARVVEAAMARTTDRRHCIQAADAVPAGQRCDPDTAAAPSRGPTTRTAMGLSCTNHTRRHCRILARHTKPAKEQIGGPSSRSSETWADPDAGLKEAATEVAVEESTRGRRRTVEGPRRRLPSGRAGIQRPLGRRRGGGRWREVAGLGFRPSRPQGATPGRWVGRSTLQN
jgi:hypothetical protein